MTHEDNKNRGLDEAISAVRKDTPSSEAVQNASGRVWARIQSELPANAAGMEQIHGCEDVRALLPAYAAGKVPQARALLIRAHLHECAECRRLEQSGTAAARAWTSPVAAIRNGWTWRGYALATALAVVIGVSALIFWQTYMAVPSGAMASVQSVDGTLYTVSDTGERILHQGDELTAGQLVRTSGNGHAFLRLLDGSIVEMNDRSEFSVSARRRDTTVNLDQGRIIIQAAKRKTGHLYVDTPDCRVAVTGTVFAVNAGMKGSRVAVVEGEVHVAHAGIQNVLHSGDVVATSASIAAVPVKDEIAWSRNLEKHLELLAQFAQLQKKFEQIPTPGLRYSSAVLTHVPINTVVYASMPNLGDALSEANRIFQEQMQQSPVLQEWWNKGHKQGNAPTFEQMVEKIHKLSQYLGDEVVLIGLSGHGNGLDDGVLMAPIRQQGAREFMQTEFAALTQNEKGADFRVVNQAELASVPVSKNKGQMIALVRPDFLLLSPSVAALRNMSAQLDAGGGSFASTGLGSRIAAAYSKGADFLLGVDLQQIMAESSNKPNRKPKHDDEALQKTGFKDIRYLIAEHREISGTPDNRALLEFAGQRYGIASWLAAPAPIGSLDFVSANASMAFGAVTKDPAAMMDDILQMAGTDAKAGQDLAEAQAKLNVDLRNDLAASFGGDFAFAVDGPILPTPSWKVVAEVYNPAKLQGAIGRLVEFANQEAAKHNRPGLQLQQQEANGRTFYTVRSLDAKMLNSEMTYTFSDGYMIMAPSRALVLNALRIKANGDSLSKSPEFMSLLPRDRYANVSGVMYQNLAPVMKPIASQLTPKQLQALQQLAADAKPTVICAYGEDNGIELVSTSRLFPFDTNMMAFSAIMGAHEPGTSHRQHP